jgi:hypothetical protein
MAETPKLEEYKEIDDDKLSYFRNRAQEYTSGGLKVVKETGKKLYTHLKESIKSKPISVERKAIIDRRNREIEEAQHQRKIRAIQEAPIERQTSIRQNGSFLNRLGKSNPLNKKDSMGMDTDSDNMGASFSINNKFFEFKNTSSKTPDFGIKMNTPINPMGISKKKNKKYKTKKETSVIKQFGGY